MRYKWPLPKVQAIVARGGGIPDPDAPGVAECTQYWCYVSQSIEDEEMTQQRAQTRIQADTSSASLGALFNHTSPTAAAGQVSTLTTEQVQSIEAATMDAGGPVSIQNLFYYLFIRFLIFEKYM